MAYEVVNNTETMVSDITIWKIFARQGSTEVAFQILLIFLQAEDNPPSSTIFPCFWPSLTQVTL